jgi:hypothetical protein
MKRNIISDINEIELLIYTKTKQLRINCKNKKWIESTELKRLYWIFYSSA